MASKLFSQGQFKKAGPEADQVIRLTGISPPCSVLDLCCGPGRHAVEFASRGYRVTGVDKNSDYLTEARSRAEGLDIEFIETDMREFRRPDAFSLVINLYTSFGYFEDPADDRKVLENVYASLAPGGTFIMELMGKEVLAGIFKERDWYEEDGVIYLEERKILDNWKWVEARWIKLEGEEIEEYTVSHRLYSARELSDLLYTAGFKNIDIYGSLTGIPYDQNAERLVVTAGKPVI